MTTRETALLQRASELPATTPLFMSQQHVDLMNSLLQQADAVKRACAALGSSRVLSYDLAGGPNGETVHWTMTLEDTVQFSLDRPARPDVLFTGDWSSMIRASQSAQAGDPQDPGLTVHGDTDIVTQVSAILVVAQQVAAVPVTFPEV